jgi:hypothetical protein
VLWRSENRVRYKLALCVASATALQHAVKNKAREQAGAQPHTERVLQIYSRKRRPPHISKVRSVVGTPTAVLVIPEEFQRAQRLGLKQSPNVMERCGTARALGDDQLLHMRCLRQRVAQPPESLDVRRVDFRQP